VPRSAECAQSVRKVADAIRPGMAIVPMM